MNFTRIPVEATGSGGHFGWVPEGLLYWYLCRSWWLVGVPFSALRGPLVEGSALRGPLVEGPRSSDPLFEGR